jgi:hypothetical protein
VSPIVDALVEELGDRLVMEGEFCLNRKLLGSGSLARGLGDLGEVVGGEGGLVDKFATPASLGVARKGMVELGAL